MRRTAALALMATALLAACGDGVATFSSTLCDYYDVDGCTVFGLVLADPLPTAEALAVAADLRGVPIAVWRTELTCVRQASSGPPGGSSDPLPKVPSRFAYVDAEDIRDRHLAASGSVAPPITGLHIFESYWSHYVDQWVQAQQPGVLVEAVAVYLPDTSASALAEDARFRSVVSLSSERTESVSSSYHGELIVDGFPSGYLSVPTDIVCE